MNIQNPLKSGFFLVLSQMGLQLLLNSKTAFQKNR